MEIEPESADVHKAEISFILLSAIDLASTCNLWLRRFC